MGLSVTPTVVNTGDPITVTYSYERDKSGGLVALFPGGVFAKFRVQLPDGTPPSYQWYLGLDPPQNHGDPANTSGSGFLNQWAPAVTWQTMNGASGVTTFIAPSPGPYYVQTIYAPDGGSIDSVALTVVAAAAPPAIVSNSWDAANNNPRVADNGTIVPSVAAAAAALTLDDFNFPADKRALYQGYLQQNPALATAAYQAVLLQSRGWIFGPDDASYRKGSQTSRPAAPGAAAVPIAQRKVGGLPLPAVAAGGILLFFLLRGRH